MRLKRTNSLNFGGVTLKTYKTAGFTLAEVLITLGIIGVVAAMTIPNLMANIQGTRVRTQFKKAISTLNQAVKMNVAQYDWDFSNIEGDFGTGYCNGNSHPEDKTTTCALLNANLSGETFIGYMKDSPGENDYSFNSSNKWGHFGSAAWFAMYQLQDGSIIGMSRSPSDGACTQSLKNTKKNAVDYSCTGFIDVNGKTLPNKEIECENPSDTKAYWESGYKDCAVKLKGGVGDVFPIVFYDSTVEPSTNAGRYVLNTSK